MSIDDRHDMAERIFLLREERSFADRAKADRTVGRWAAGLLGLSGEAAETYALDVMRAGVASAGGRGGFDRVLRDLAPLSTHPEAVRTRYAIALLGAVEPIAVAAGPRATAAVH
ncbi:ATPase inhibitor subunit zeta [Aureimonas sp. AU4]|uniref:ATPase inhibitor subunit zeta n=1 Tax=Aureimonas sp. AU4 TaxID=1638163 RepID=UPI000783AA4D|nr:ATPase inhibitor subunit zeta [Aureimonas sp. AU4]